MGILFVCLKPFRAQGTARCLHTTPLAFAFQGQDKLHSRYSFGFRRFRATKKKKQKVLYEKNDCNKEVLEDIAEVPPPKKKHAETTGNKKGKKGITILCVAKPPEQVPEQNLESATLQLEQELSPSPDIFRDIATPESEQMLVSSQHMSKR